MASYLAKFSSGLVEAVTVRDFEGPLGKGATATVFSASIGVDNSFAAKIYHDPNTIDIKRLILLTEKNPLGESSREKSFYSFAWPRAQVLDPRTYAPVGFLMKKVDLTSSFPLSATFVSPLRASNGEPHWPLNLRCQIAQRLSEATAELHSNYFLITDFKPENIRVTKSGSITFLDCDSFGVEAPGFRVAPTHFSAGYICPELLKNNRGPDSAGFSQDLFALGVLLFKLLNYGIHPFQGVITNGVDLPSDDDKVREGLYPYGLSNNPRIKPTPISIHHCINPSLRLLFDRCFQSEDSRPTASQWANELNLLFRSASFSKCDAYPTDVNHIRFANHKCAVCNLGELKSEREKRLLKPKAVLSEPKRNLTPGKSVNNANSPVMVGLITIGIALLCFILVVGINDFIIKKNREVPNINNDSQRNSNKCVYFDLKTYTNSDLCRLYHENGCKSNDIISELVKRRLHVDPQYLCGQPTSLSSPTKASNRLEDIEIRMPQPFEKKLLSIEERRWCITESRWIDSSRNYNYSDNYAEYTEYINFYNDRCAKRTFIVAENARAEDEVTALTKAVQSELNRLGYAVGGIDGMYGVNTANAISQYRRDRGKPNAIFGGDLLKELKSAR